MSQQFDFKDREAVRRLLSSIQQRYGLSGPKGAMLATSLVLEVVVEDLHEAIASADDQDASQWMNPKAAQKLRAASGTLADAAREMHEAVRSDHGGS